MKSVTRKHQGREHLTLLAGKHTHCHLRNVCPALDVALGGIPLIENRCRHSVWKSVDALVTTLFALFVLQAQREYPPSLNDCKDKFLVQSLVIKKDTTEITPDLFEAASGKDIKQSKLRVVLVGPPKPPSPVPEGVEEEASPIRVRLPPLPSLPGTPNAIDCALGCCEQQD